MDDLDFSQQAAPSPRPAPAKPAISAAPVYDTKLALRFFNLSGETESFEAGKQIFAENDKTGGGFFSKGARIYLLLEGQVGLTLHGKPLHLILPGEVFGEMALITDAPRSAAATALKKSRVLALDEKRFLTSLPQAPEFALMLVGVLAAHLKRGIERLQTAMPGTPLSPRQSGNGLTGQQITELGKLLGNPTPTAMRAGETIVSAGALGMFMFVVTAGRVTITVNGMEAEHIGPGETFGEMALLGNNSRAATAIAESDGTWLAVTRQEFLDIVTSFPAIGISLLRSMCERVQHINQQLAR